MTPAHIHLAVNHAPIFGLLFGLIALCFGLYRKSNDILRAALLIFVIAGLFAIPTYFSGEGAEEIVEHQAGVEHDFIEAHEEQALVSLIAMAVTALLSLVLFVRHYRTDLPRGLTLGILGLALISLILVGITSNLGGQLRHPEIREGFESVTTHTE